MKVVKAIELFFQEGSSDKVYNAKIVEDGGGLYTVHVEWGRRGSGLNTGTKAVKVPLAKAERELDKVVREKTNKGYEERTGTVAPAPVAPPAGQGSASKVGGKGRKKLAQAAQLLNPCSPAEVEALLAEAKVIAQPKLDGARVLLHVLDEVVATNRAGQLTALAPAELLACAAAAPKGTILDGELVGSTYHVFDLLRFGDKDLRSQGYLTRWLALDTLLVDLEGPVQLVPTARTEKEKRALLKRLQEQRAEGIIFKRVDAPYVAGRPSSGGTQLKHKFTKTADVVITENAGNAYAMMVYEDGTERAIGKVFAGTTNASRKELDARLGKGERPVAEVEYLYATDDDQLFQPVFRGLRDDKDAEECTLDQLVHAGDA
jgi:bifunctional non-homologous end joining protein LigD